MRFLILCTYLLFSFSVATNQEELPCFFEDSKKWKLVSYKNLITNSETERPWRYDKFFEVIIQFDYDEALGGGTFEGQSLSNVISGSYKLTEAGLEILDFEDSQMREPAWGLDSLRIAMHTVSNFECSGDTLLLNYNKERNAMVFVKTETVFYDWDEYLRTLGGTTSID
ncbi:MAG: hypothetical protein AB8F74_20320 [Saprospiraceae bacterium]